MKKYNLACLIIFLLLFSNAINFMRVFILYIFNHHTGLFMNFTSKVVPINSIKCYHQEKQILNKNMCKKIKNTILSLNKNWFKRNFMLYTLGKSSYLHDKVNTLLINNNNKFLLENFFDMYNFLINELRVILKTKNVYYKKDGFLPGFHIFVPNLLFQFPVASFHMDTQQSLNNWNKDCNLNNSISFTLSIDLPKNSPGLYLFDADKRDSRLKAICKNRCFIPYKIGKIILHHGNNWHIMAPSKINKNEYRITLQGHGIKCKDSWYIYW